MIADELPLPDHAYVPGKTERHRAGFLDDIIEQSPSETTDAGAPANVAWHYGLRLLTEGYFWEAHEILESVWLRSAPNSREKYLLQALIHMANAALKVKMNRGGAAARLSTRAQFSVKEAFQGAEPRTVMGLNERSMTHMAHECAGQEFIFSRISVI